MHLGLSVQRYLLEELDSVGGEGNLPEHGQRARVFASCRRYVVRFLSSSAGRIPSRGMHIALPRSVKRNKVRETISN